MFVATQMILVAAPTNDKHHVECTTDVGHNSGCVMLSVLLMLVTPLLFHARFTADVGHTSGCVMLSVLLMLVTPGAAMLGALLMLSHTRLSDFDKSSLFPLPSLASPMIPTPPPVFNNNNINSEVLWRLFSNEP